MNLFENAPIKGPRVFGIGFNKTGTTTLGKCFDLLGIGPVARPQALHDLYYGNSRDALPRADAPLAEQRRAFFESYPYRAICREFFDYGNLGLALHAASAFRAFHDRPWNVGRVYEVLDILYPGSRFILTSRDSETWWRSVDQWLNVRHPDDPEKRYRYLRHLEVATLEKSSCIDAYEAHNERIRCYFSSRTGDFLELRMESDFRWEPLCEFLEFPVPALAFPFENKQDNSTPP